MEQTQKAQDSPDLREDRLSIPLLLLMLLMLTRLTRFTRVSLVGAGEGTLSAEVTDLDPSKLLAAVLVALFVAALLMWPRRKLIRIDWPVCFLTIFLIYALISVLWAYDAGLTLLYTVKMFQWVLLYVLIISLTRNRADLDRWGIATLAGSFVVLAAMLSEMYVPDIRGLGGATPDHATDAYLEIYPRWAVFFLPFGVHFVLHGRSARLRRWAGLAGAAGLLTVYLSFRRAGPLGIFVALTVYMVLAGWKNRSFVAVCAIFLLIAVMIPIADPSYAQRITDLPMIGGTTFETWGSQMRIYQYVVGFEVFTNHPIAGIGLAGAQRWGLEHYGNPLSQHNLILKLGAESGIIGIALYGLFVVAAVKRALLPLKRRRAEDDLEGESWCAAVIATLIQVLFWAQIQPLMQALPIYLAAALGSSSARILGQKQTSEA